MQFTDDDSALLQFQIFFITHFRSWKAMMLLLVASCIISSPFHLFMMIQYHAQHSRTSWKWKISLLFALESWFKFRLITIRVSNDLPLKFHSKRNDRDNVSLLNRSADRISLINQIVLQYYRGCIDSSVARNERQGCCCSCCNRGSQSRKQIGNWFPFVINHSIAQPFPFWINSEYSYR